MTQRLTETLTEQMDRMRSSGMSAAPGHENERIEQLMKRLVKVDEQNQQLREELNLAQQKLNGHPSVGNERGRNEEGFTHQVSCRWGWKSFVCFYVKTSALSVPKI